MKPVEIETVVNIDSKEYCLIAFHRQFKDELLVKLLQATEDTKTEWWLVQEPWVLK